MNLLKNFLLFIFASSIGFFLLFAWPKKKLEFASKKTTFRSGKTPAELKEEIVKLDNFSYEFTEPNFSIVEKGIVFQNKNESNSYHKLKEILGWLPPENSVIRMQKSLKNKIIFDKIYTTSMLGQRITKQNPGNKHLLILGGSNTFGIGVNDDETFPFYLANGTDKFTIYNFGVEGFGPSHFPLFIKNQNLQEVVSEKQGALVFYFFPFLIKRVFGGLEYILSTKGRSPEYILDKNNLKHKGAFKDGLKYKILSQLGKSQLISKAIIKSEHVGTKELLLLKEVFRKTKEEYLKQFPTGNFIIYLPNVYGWKNTPWRAEFLKILNDDRISYFESNNKDEKDFYYKESHLKPKAHFILARELLKSNKL